MRKSSTLASLLIKYKWLILVLLIVWIIICIKSVSGLVVDVDFKNFFPKNDPVVEEYHSIISELGNNDNYLMVGIEPDRNIFEENFLNRIHQFTLECRNISAVESASSITTVKRLRTSPFGLIPSSYVNLNHPAGFFTDSLGVFNHYEYLKTYISENGDRLVVVIQLFEDLSPNDYDYCIEQLELLGVQFDFHEFHIVGLRALEVHYQRLMKSEFAKSIIVSLALIVVLLIFFYRSVIKLIIPLLTVIIALISLYGFMAITGRSLGIMSSLFPTIILIVGISDSIHMITKYQREWTRTGDYFKTLEEVIKEVGLSISLTSITTILGLLTLLTSKMQALVDFGIEASVGIFFAYLVSVTFVPAALLLVAKNSNHRTDDYLNWNRISNKIMSVVNTHGHRIIQFTVLAFILAIIGIRIIDMNNLQLSNIPNEHKLVEDYTFFEENLGGTRSFEIAIYTRDTFRLNQRAILDDLKQLHHFLQDSTPVDYVLSPVTWYSGLHSIDTRTSIFPELPADDTRLSMYDQKLGFTLNRTNWQLVNKEKNVGRVAGRIKDMGRININHLNQRVMTWAEMNLDTSRIALAFTGKDLLIDKGHEHRVQNMFVGLSLAILMVAGFIGMIYRDAKMTILTILVNLLPLVFVAGLMGYAGIELRGTTSIIFAIGFVIAVDDTIHFISKFQIERAKNQNIQQAISRTILETGKAIFTTSVILFAGFVALIVSPFGDISNVGVMVGAMVVFALFTDLFLFPVLLKMCYKKDANDSLI